MGSQASRSPPSDLQPHRRTITLPTRDRDFLISGDAVSGMRPLSAPSTNPHLAADTTSSGTSSLSRLSIFGTSRVNSQHYYEDRLRVIARPVVPFPSDSDTRLRRRRESYPSEHMRHTISKHRTRLLTVPVLHPIRSHPIAENLQIPVHQNADQAPVETPVATASPLPDPPVALPDPPAAPPLEDNQDAAAADPSLSFQSHPTMGDAELPYRLYFWPEDSLPLTLMKSDGVSDMLCALRGQMDTRDQTNVAHADDGIPAQGSDDDPDLVELANELLRDEMEKREQIKQEKVLEYSKHLPEWCLFRSQDAPPKVDEIPDKKEEPDCGLVPCAFNWAHGGHSIYLTGSFDAWATDRKIKLARSGHEFTAIKELPRAVHYYKFIVDDQWKFAPNQPTHTDEHGNVNNVLDLTEYQVYNFTVAKEHEQARDATYHQFVPGSNDYTTDAPVIPLLLSKSNCVAADPPSRISTPLHALANHLYHDSHVAHLFGPHIASVTSTQRWRHTHKSPLSTAGLRFSTLVYVTFNPLFLLHGDANFELYAASPIRSLISCRNSRNQASDINSGDTMPNSSRCSNSNCSCERCKEQRISMPTTTGALSFPVSISLG